MFNINEIWQWREQIDANPELRLRYNGRQMASVEMGFPEEPPPQAEVIGELYPPTAIFGCPSDPTCLDRIEQMPINTSPPLLRTYSESRIVGFSALFSEDKLEIAYAPSAANAKEFMDYNVYGAQGFIAERLDDRVFIHFDMRPQPYYFDQHALFFPNLEPGNYGSFLFRVLPHLLYVAPMELSVDCYIVAERTSWMLEALRILGFPPRPIYSAREVSGDIFASVTMCTMHDLEGFIRPMTRRAIRRLAGDIGVSPPKVGKKIYVSRDLQYHAWPSYREMLNELEIQALAISKGFEVVRPETMSLTDQMRVFGSASHIVGASGSGMLNSLFGLQPARIVDIESYHVTVLQHAKIYASCGHDYSFAFGDMDSLDDKAPHLKRWTAPADVMNGAFDWCLS